MVGFDLFMAVVAIVLAIFLTWLTAWWYLAAQHRQAAHAGAPYAGTTLATRALATTAPATSTPATRVPGTTASGPRASETSFNRSKEIKPLTVAAALSAPVLLVDLLHIIVPSALPGWMNNPWLQVIVITPVVFYCGMPIAIEGWETLKRHTPDMDTLTMIGAAAAYLYSLALCIAPGVLPDDPNGPYFGFVGLAVTLALLGRYLAIRATVAANVNGNGIHDASADASAGSDSNSPNDRTVATARRDCPAPVRRYRHLTLWCVPIAMIAATWSFALCIVFGYQPRLAHAIVAAFCMLMVVGLTLAAIKTGMAWRLLHEHAGNRRAGNGPAPANAH